MLFKNSSECYKLVQQIRCCSGTNAKKELLRQGGEDIATYLYYAYHPHMHYNIKPTLQRTTGNGIDEINDNFKDLLNGLNEGTLSGYAAKRTVKKYLQTLDFYSLQLAICVLNKSMSFGLATKSINEVFTGLIPEHAIQLAKPINYSKLTYPVLVSPKLDGLRAIYKHGHFYSRLGNKFKGLDKLEGDMLALLGPHAGGITLDGELMVEGEHFNEINGQLRSFNATDKAIYNIFDIPSLGTTQQHRYRACETLIFNTEGVSIQIVPHTLAHSIVEISGLYEHAINGGYEGLIVKDPNAEYVNSRTWAWQKVKPTHAIDAKVIGTFEGHGKYEGMCGGLIIDLNGVKVKIGSGLSDAQRGYWADDSSEIIGSTIEVAYQEVTPDGSLRHPRLKTVRGDK